MLITPQYKKNLKNLSPIIGWIAFLISVYMPFLVYRANSEYFSETYLILLGPIAVVVAPFMLCILLIVAFLPKRISCYLTAILIVCGILMWLQGDLFAVSYGQLDGLGMSFYPYMQRGLFEVLIVGICLIVAVIFHHKINQYGPTIIALIFIAQLGIIGISLLSDKKQTINKQQSVNTDVDEEIFAFSSEDNVVVIVLDAFGSEFFQKILLQNEKISHELQGFVSYKDAISQYPQTRSSLVSFLTGKMISEGVNYSEYLRNTVAKRGMPKYYENHGYLVSVISTAYVWFSEFYQKRFLYRVPAESQQVSNASDGMKLLDYSLFRSSPHIFKHHIYNSGFWFFSDYFSGYTRKPDIYPTRSAEMMDYYPTKIHVSDSSSRFKFLHFVLPHPKFVYDEYCEFKTNIKYSDNAMLQQSKCALKKLLTLFKAMKEKGVYDNSLIVVMSDHGAKMYKNSDEIGMPSEFELKSSGVLLMIKDKYAVGELIQNDSSVSLLGVSEFLKQVPSKNQNSLEVEKKRLYYSYRSNIGFIKSDIPAGVIYQVGPEYSKIDSWEVLKTVTGKCDLVEPVGQVNLHNNKKESYCYKYGFDDFSDSIGGLGLLGNKGVVVWETKAILPTAHSYELIVKVKSKHILSAMIQINGNPSSRIPLLYNVEKQEFKGQFNPSVFKNNTKLELFISAQIEHKKSDKLLPSNSVIVKSIKTQPVD